MAAPSVRNVQTTIQNTDTATSIQITKPTNTAENDVMYAFISLAVSTGTPALAGWALVTNQNVVHDGGEARILFKVAGASEPADYTFTWTGGSRAVGGIVTVQGNDPVTPTAANPTPATGADANPNPPASGTVAEDDYLVLAFTCIEGKTRTFTPPSGYNEEWDHANSGAGAQTGHESQSLATLPITAATSEDPGTFTASASDGWAAFTILVAPALPTVFLVETLVPMALPQVVAY